MPSKTQSSTSLLSSSPRCIGFALLLLCLMLTLRVQAQVTRFAGAIAVGANGGTQSVPVTFTAGGTVAGIKVLTAGAEGYDFAPALGSGCSTGLSYSAGQSCNVSVSFTPTAPGARRGAVVLLDSRGATLGMQLLSGSATGSLIAFVPGEITTVAGNNYWLWGGDGALATESSIFLPFGVAVDGAGNLYISDTNNSRIRKVTASTGLISTIAGTGTIGSTGDGGLAINATLSTPSSVALDPAGNLYFADSGNNVVRRIDAFSGIITTVAGTIGLHGYAGDGAAATTALLNGPNGLCFDGSGNLYIADTGNNVIRLLNGVTGTISTYVGKGFASYTGDGGAATAATLNGPRGLTVSLAGELYIADQNNNVIRKVSTAGIIATYAGFSTANYAGDNGPLSGAYFNSPAAVAFDVAGNLYIADAGNNRIRKVSSTTGKITTAAGSYSQSIVGDNGPANAAGLYGPYDMAIDSAGSLYFADVFHNRIRKVSSNLASILYTPQRVGRTSAPTPQLLENDGNVPLTVGAITSVSNAAVDAATTTCGSSTLSVMDQCTIGVSFAPTTIGAEIHGTINVSSNAVNAPGIINLQGQVLDVDPTTVTLSSSANPSNTGVSVNFNVIASSAGTTPTGTITLLDGTATLGVASLVSGTANFNIATLTAGTHSLTASYSGDTSNTAGVSAVLTQVVKDPSAATKTTISSTANPTVAGAALGLNASVTVAVAGAGTGTISGTVSFYDGASLLGSGAVNNGSATVSVTSMTVGTHSVTAIYNGDTNYAKSTSAVLSESVTIATSTIAVSTSANPSVANAALTLSATTSSTGGVATGTVTFYDGTVKLGTSPLGAAGIATLLVPASNWTVGTHALTVAYAGDVKNTASTSAALQQVVNLATTTTAVNTSASPIGQGGSITLTATVKGNGGLPTGTVKFYDGATVLGTGTLGVDGTATLTTTTLGIGSHSVTAVYGGDASDSGSTSPALTQVVQSATTSLTLASSKTPSLYGSSLVLTMSVSGTGSVPTGSIVLMDGTATLATVPVDASGNASFATTTLAIGTHTLTAQYQGDANHSATTSTPLVQTILQGTTTTLTASATQSFAGSPITWTMNVTGANGKAVTGSIAVKDGATLVATLTPDATGRAVFTSSALAPGSHTMVAAYAGDTTNASSSSNAVVNIVSIATTTTALSTSLNPAFSGTAVTFRVIVSGNGGAPTGSVTFFDGTSRLSTVVATPDATTATATATLSVTTLAPGIHTITAQYSGDTNDGTSVSAALSQQIVQQTSLTLTSSANPSLLTDNVTITATVSNGTGTSVPTGSITLTDGGAAVGSALIGANGTATFTLTSPSLGTHALLATYGGDSQNTAATPATLTQTVVLRPTVNTLTLSTTAITAGQQAILLSVVTGQGSRLPGGTVTFTASGTTLGTATLSSQGIATLSISPDQGTYGVVATYSGDSLYASSASTVKTLVVAPTVAFTLKATPNTMSMQSGQHGTLSVALVTASTLTDTLTFGCAGLPASATCTFSQTQMKVSGGVSTTISVTVDTGNPLGSGGVAEVHQGKSLGVLACMLPLGGLIFLFGRGRRYRRGLELLAVVLMLGGMATLSGCASGLHVNNTPAGTYVFEIVGSGVSSGSTQSTAVQLTVTQ